MTMNKIFTILPSSFPQIPLFWLKIKSLGTLTYETAKVSSKSTPLPLKTVFIKNLSAVSIETISFD